MNRLLGAFAILIAGLLCFDSVFGLIQKLAKYIVIGYGRLVKFLNFGPTGIESVAIDSFARGVLQGDSFFLRLLYLLENFLLLSGLIIIFALVSSRREAVVFAKYWCFFTLVISLLYIAGAVLSPFMQWPPNLTYIAGYFSQRIGALFNLVVQLIFVGIASILFDKELNKDHLVKS